MAVSSQVEEMEITPELQEQMDATAQYLAKRQAEDEQADVTSRVGRINNGLDKADDQKEAKAETDKEAKTDKEPEKEAKTETETGKETDKEAKTDKEPEKEAKTETETGKETDKEAKTDKEPTKSARNRARREEAMRRAIQAETDQRYQSQIAALQQQIDDLKANPKAETETDKEAKTDKEPEKEAKPETETETKGEAPEMPKIADYGADRMDEFYDAMDKYDEDLAAWKAGNNDKPKTAAAPATQPEKKAAPQTETRERPKDPLATTQERTLAPIEEHAKVLAEVLEDHEADEVLEDLVGLAEGGQVLLSEALLEDLTSLDDEEAIVKIATAIRDKPRLSQKLSRIAKSARAKEFKKLIAPSKEDTETEPEKTTTTAIRPLRPAPGSNGPQIDMDNIDTGEYLRIRQEEENRNYA